MHALKGIFGGHHRDIEHTQKDIQQKQAPKGKLTSGQQTEQTQKDHTVTPMNLSTQSQPKNAGAVPNKTLPSIPARPSHTTDHPNKSTVASKTPPARPSPDSKIVHTTVNPSAPKDSIPGLSTRFDAIQKLVTKTTELSEEAEVHSMAYKKVLNARLNENVTAIALQDHKTADLNYNKTSIELYRQLKDVVEFISSLGNVKLSGEQFTKEINLIYKWLDENNSSETSLYPFSKAAVYLTLFYLNSSEGKIQEHKGILEKLSIRIKERNSENHQEITAFAFLLECICEKSLNWTEDQRTELQKAFKTYENSQKSKLDSIAMISMLKTGAKAQHTDVKINDSILHSCDYVGEIYNIVSLFPRDDSALQSFSTNSFNAVKKSTIAKEANSALLTYIDSCFKQLNG